MDRASASPVLYLVIPCYNEEEVLPVTSPLFLEKLEQLIGAGQISAQSRILLVDDGSRDRTWEIISSLCRSDRFAGISLSRNRGHQNALLAGLMTAKEYADITISIDCDGQDDINAMDEMISAYLSGNDVVYGVRNSRDTDTFFKRATAEGFYRLLGAMGVETVFNHADYRLLSRRVLEELERFDEVNLYLRGMIPLVGFSSTSVYYRRTERMAGKSHYPFRKMLALALDGITSLSVKPIRLITAAGFLVACFSFVVLVWAVIQRIMDHTVAGWTSLVCALTLLSGVQLIALGIVGEYVGKIYLETKHRPKYIIRENTLEREG